jgi:arsenate reductase-like glutaredoxin family protein
VSDFTIYHNPRCSKSRNTLQLIEQPIVVRGERAVLGRPPEKVLELLD